MTIILADRAYIPKNRVKRRQIADGFEKHVYKESACSNCDNKPDRFNDICATCPSYMGFFKTWRQETIKGRDYYAVPYGDKDLLLETLDIDLDEEKIIDKRSDVRMSVRPKFTGKLHTGKEVINGIRTANQRRLVKKFWKFKRGLIKAKPRTGKTVMASRLICAYGRRTLFIAHERELLKQALRTIRKFTNIRDLEKKVGRKLIGIVQKDSDWDENWDIVLCTYHKFITPKGQKRIRKYVHKKFGLLVVDEVHRANAFAYSKFVDFIDTRFSFGLTATDKRKDGLEFLVEQIMGPVVVEATAPGLTPEVFIHDTKLRPKYEWKGMTAYTKAITWMAEHKERNNMLIKQVFRDLRANPKHCIVIPVMRVKHADMLAKAINKKARIYTAEGDEDWSPHLALAYRNGSNRDKVLKAIREGDESRVIVAIRKMVQEGTDIPTLTHMYLQFPINNDANFFQMTQRICTPMEGKPTPVLRMFVDNIGLSEGCFVPTWFRGVKANKYKVSDKTEQDAKAILDRKASVRKAMSDENRLPMSELW